jgi:DNA-binding NarL/FixJ family response regulator
MNVDCMRTRIQVDKVIQLIAEGKANKEIADELATTKGTIECVVHKLLRKHKCKNRTELAVKFTSAA